MARDPDHVGGLHLRACDNLVNSQVWSRDFHLQLSILAARLARAHEHGLLATAKEWEAIVFSLALGEANDLLFDVAHGRGRQALRSGRALFELCLYTLELRANPDLAASFIDEQVHTLSVAAPAVERLREAAGDLLMPGPETASMANSTRRSAPRTGRGWSGKSIRQLACSHGLADEYDTFFAIASAVTHPAAFSAVGGMTHHESGTVVELGSSTFGAALALSKALKFLAQILTQLPVAASGEVLKNAICETSSSLVMSATRAEDVLDWWRKTHAWHMTSNLVLVASIAAASNDSGLFRRSAPGRMITELWFAIDVLDNTFAPILVPRALPPEARRLRITCREDVLRPERSSPRVFGFLDPSMRAPVQLCGTDEAWRPVDASPFKEHLDTLQPLLDQARDRLRRIETDPRSFYLGFSGQERRDGAPPSASGDR